MDHKSSHKKKHTPVSTPVAVINTPARSRSRSRSKTKSHTRSKSSNKSPNINALNTEQIKTSMDSYDILINEINTKISSLEKKVHDNLLKCDIDTQILSLETKFANLETKFDNLETKFNEKILNSVSENINVEIIPYDNVTFLYNSTLNTVTCEIADVHDTISSSSEIKYNIINQSIVPTNMLYYNILVYINDLKDIANGILMISKTGEITIKTIDNKPIYGCLCTTISYFI